MVEQDIIEINYAKGYLKIPYDLEIITLFKNILLGFEKEFKNNLLIPADDLPISGHLTRLPEDPELPQFPELPNLPKDEKKDDKIESYQEFFTKCPICNGKLKKKSIKRNDEELRQLIKCKNRKCKFEKEYLISL